MRLIIRFPNWVGDAVMALPLLDQIKDLINVEHLAVMARKSTAPLVAEHPSLDELIILEDDLHKIRGVRDGVKAVKKGRFTAGLILPPSFSSALIFYLGQVSKRIGYQSDGRSLLLTDAMLAPSVPSHRSKNYLKILEQISDQRPEERQPKISLSERDISGANEKLFQKRVSSDDKYIAISPRAVALSRRWGVDNYGALAKRVHEATGCKVVLVGGPSDREAGEAVKKYDPVNIVNLCGETNLMEAASLLSKAQLFIGNDSGLAHLAGAVDCPMVVLSGADNPVETSPLASRKTVIVKDISCIGCVKNSCPLTGEEFMSCMTMIKVDEVADAAFKWMRA